MRATGTDGGVVGRSASLRPIVYRPHPNATPEVELDALAAVYAFVLRCGEAQRAEEIRKAAGRLPSPDGRNDAKEIENDCAAEPEYNR